MGRGIFLWCLIDKLKGKIELVYLQVFELKSEPFKNKYKVSITHSQEVLAYPMVHTLYIDKAVNGKIFVIDDKTHSTMLWSFEY